MVYCFIWFRFCLCALGVNFYVWPCICGLRLTIGYNSVFALRLIFANNLFKVCVKEKYVMEYVYQKCQGKKSCLISPREIISFVADKYVLYPDELEKIMTNLSYDNYIELFKSDKKGSPVFCVSLKIKGEGFHRELTNSKRNLWYQIVTKVGLALLVGVIGLVFALIKIKF